MNCFHSLIDFIRNQGIDSETARILLVSLPCIAVVSNASDLPGEAEDKFDDTPPKSRVELSDMHQLRDAGASSSFRRKRTFSASPDEHGVAAVAAAPDARAAVEDEPDTDLMFDENGGPSRCVIHLFSSSFLWTVSAARTSFEFCSLFHCLNSAFAL